MLNTTNRIEVIILANLIYNDPFIRKVFPFLKSEYFDLKAECCIFEAIHDSFVKYNNPPTKESVLIDVSKRNDLTEKNLDDVKELIDEIAVLHANLPDINWLIDSTEKWCKERALFIGLMQSVAIIDGRDKNHTKEHIPTLLSEALGVSFEDHIGHNFIEDSDDRFAFYHDKALKFPVGLKYIDKITKGGVSAKTLNVIIAGPNVGKSLVMCDFAARFLTNGKNVLYITLEMAREWIGLRIDQNLMGMSSDEIESLPLPIYQQQIAKIKAKVGNGQLIIQEYSTGGAHSGHFRHLIRELQLKKKFKPDVIVIDYINICASAKLKRSGVNSYEWIKAIAEELRGLATEFNVPIWTGSQTTRSGFGDSDIDIDNIAESFGLPATADFIIALMTNDTLEKLNQFQVKQLKNRYNSKVKDKRFIIGVDYNKMRLFDVEESAQAALNDSGQEPVKTEKQERIEISKQHGSQAYESAYPQRKFVNRDKKKNFEDWKI